MKKTLLSLVLGIASFLPADNAYSQQPQPQEQISANFYDRKIRIREPERAVVEAYLNDRLKLSNEICSKIESQYSSGKISQETMFKNKANSLFYEIAREAVKNNDKNIYQEVLKHAADTSGVLLGTSDEILRKNLEKGYEIALENLKRIRILQGNNETAIETNIEFLKATGFCKDYLLLMYISKLVDQKEVLRKLEAFEANEKPLSKTKTKK